MIKNNAFTLFIASVALFFSCAGKTGHKHTIVSVESVYVERIINYDTVSAENISTETERVIAVFSKQKDSITTYIFQDADLQQSSEINQFSSKKLNENSRIIFSEFYEDTIQVVFNANNEIAVDMDVYKVTKAYYVFLKQAVITEGLLLPFIDLIKDGYGDYCTSFKPLLDYKWDKVEPNPAHSITEVLVRNKNYQSSDNDADSWKILYENGNAEGEHYKKSIVEENKHFKKIITEYDNERYQQSKLIYTDKSTLLDSISGTWEAYSQSMETYNLEFEKWQSKLEIFQTDQSPKNAQEALDFLKLKSNN